MLPPRTFWAPLSRCGNPGNCAEAADWRMCAARYAAMPSPPARPRGTPRKNCPRRCVPDRQATEPPRSTPESSVRLCWTLSGMTAISPSNAPCGWFPCCSSVPVNCAVPNGTNLISPADSGLSPRNAWRRNMSILYLSRRRQ